MTKLSHCVGIIGADEEWLTEILNFWTIVNIYKYIL